MLIIYYAPPNDDGPGRFALAAPPQVIPGYFERGRFRADLRLEYGTCDPPGPEYRRLGTFHSHGNVSPRHSAIDAADEIDDTGLHLTAGYVDSRRPEFSAVFVVAGTRFAVRASQVLSPFVAARRPPDAWLNQVTVGYRDPLDDRGWQGEAPCR